MMPLTALVIHGQAALHGQLDECLTGMVGRLLHAWDFRVGLALARRTLPDVIISTVEGSASHGSGEPSHPSLDGFSLCQALRRQPETEDIPVIIVGDPDDRFRERALEAGALDYLSRPVDCLMLRARVRAAMRLHRVLLEVRSRQSAPACKLTRPRAGLFDPIPTPKLLPRSAEAAESF